MVLIIDFGSQYTQLIARKVRELNVFCEIHPYHKVNEEMLYNIDNKGVILSGGPASVNDPGAPNIPGWIFGMDMPILGICYGMQLMVKAFGGQVGSSGQREYGYNQVKLNKKKSSPLLQGVWGDVHNHHQVWMSHGDKVVKMPKVFQVLGESHNGAIAVIAHRQKEIYGLQFHPEVHHTPHGKELLQNFLYRICRCKQDWTPESFITKTISSIRETVGKENVVLGLSGGVDSSVTSILVHEAIGKQLTNIFVDNGLLRFDEAHQVMTTFEKHGIEVELHDASEIFLRRLRGVANPEKKRKIIGKTFIDVFDCAAAGRAKFLAQGTLYPDVIESVPAHGGPTDTIKSHHNVGGLPQKMNLKLIEPLRMLFKDEVRKVGKELGLADEILNRWPFPGPGLAIRLPGQSVTKEKIKILQKVGHIFEQEVRKADLYDQIWQGLAGLFPLRTVGVMGDQRTYDYSFALRAVNSVDGMTANPFEFPEGFITRVVNKIVNEVPGVNRGFEDKTSKPPGTIEWE